MKRIDNKAELKRMISDYLSGQATPEQKAFLEAYFQHFEEREDVLENFSDQQRQQLGIEMLAGLEDRLFMPQVAKTKRLWPKLAKVAAVVILFIAIGIYFYPSKNNVTEELAVADILPGGNKAVLTLADGRRISLDEARVGKLASQNGVTIHKSADGQLVYDLSQAAGGTVNGTNTIETPKGGEYQVVLPDGTKVWLNADSKLVFPAIFQGNERRVELLGEAYFEVARNKRKPFLVSSNGQTVEVLGTHFNINAYEDESNIKTTLLEGSVKVSGKISGQSMVLVPGQQSSLARTGMIKVGQVKAEDAIAWKNGYFLFDNLPLAEVMRKISRWYDVEIEYRGRLTNENFVGQVPKFEKISEVLAALELTGLAHFKVEGRRIIVMP